MNKRKDLDMKIVRAKAHALEITKRFTEYWYAEEPEEIKDGGQEIRNGTVRDKVQQSQFTEDQRIRQAEKTGTY